MTINDNANVNDDNANAQKNDHIINTFFGTFVIGQNVQNIIMPAFGVASCLGVYYSRLLTKEDKLAKIMSSLKKQYDQSNSWLKTLKILDKIKITYLMQKSAAVESVSALPPEICDKIALFCGSSDVPEFVEKSLTLMLSKDYTSIPYDAIAEQNLDYGIMKVAQMHSPLTYQTAIE